MPVKFLHRIQGLHFLTPWCYGVSLVLFGALLIWPIIESDLASTSWLLVLCIALFFLSSGAILAIAKQSTLEKKGFRAWLSRHWHRLLYWLWLGSVLALVYLSMSVIRFALSQG